MAVITLTVAQFSVAARLTTDPATAPPEPLLSVLTGILDACKEVILDYAGEQTPQAVIDEATAQMGQYLYEKPAFTRRPAYAFQHSGAESLLAFWHPPRSVVI